MKKRVLMLLWFGIMSMQHCFLLAASSNDTISDRSSAAVKVNAEDAEQVVLENGIVQLTLSKPQGYVIGISYRGIDNVLESRHALFDRGYCDVVWNEPGQNIISQRIHGTQFSIVAADESQVEVSFVRTWTSSMQGTDVPINIDQRYVLRRGSSGFYSYVILERPQGFPAVEVDQVRIVYKLQEQRFHYMAVADKRQRFMPTLEDRESGQVLAYPEAVFLTHPSNQDFKGEVDDKYEYSCENQHNRVHGWISFDSDATVGFWMITPTDEFRIAGPTKQDLTSHVGPFTLSLLMTFPEYMFVSTHYAGKEVTMAFQEGETYKKVFGPVFVYLNSLSTNQDPHTLWPDAVRQMYNEARSWPYDFPRSRDFIPSAQRGSVVGRLLVQDRYIRGGRLLYAKSAYVGLALPGAEGSWQRESKGYQFWTQADNNGCFVIKNVIPGHYNLFAWVPGFIGDYKYHNIITITPGCLIKLDSLVFNPPRNGYTVWEIGVPDRTAAEFYIPEPNPNLINKLYSEQPKDKFRQYGLWERYADLYPHDDLVYTVGVDRYDRDWFFAHVTRRIGDGEYEPTTWQIIFELEEKSLFTGSYTLQLALASATHSQLQVWVNNYKEGDNGAVFETAHMGGDNAIARHGIHGLYWLFSIEVASDLLVKGKNTIYLRQSISTDAFQGVMYDYIRFETPPTLSLSKPLIIFLLHLHGQLISYIIIIIMYSYNYLSIFNLIKPLFIKKKVF